MQGITRPENKVLMFKNQKQANLNACLARLQTQNQLTIKIE